MARTSRPKIRVPMTKADMLLEAIALLGLLVNIFIIVVFGIMLPENVPTHIGPSGGIDAYGSKWVLMGVLSIFPIFLYVLITLVSRYPHIFNYPMAITNDNAPRLYRLGKNLLRWFKVIIAWLFATMAYSFVMILPENPGASMTTSIILLSFTGALGVVSLYYMAKIFSTAGS